MTACSPLTAGAWYLLRLAFHHAQARGKVRPGPKREYGHAEINVNGQSRLFEGLPPSLNVWHVSRRRSAGKLPAGFSVMARSSNALAAMENESKKIWAVQFHPESITPSAGVDLLRNFVVNILRPRVETGRLSISSTKPFVRCARLWASREE